MCIVPVVPASQLYVHTNVTLVASNDAVAVCSLLAEEDHKAKCMQFAALFHTSSVADAHQSTNHK